MRKSDKLKKMYKANILAEGRYLNKESFEGNNGNINESLLAIGGALVGAAVVNYAAGKIKNHMVDKTFEKTGEKEVITGKDGGELHMVGYTNKKTGNHYWGFDVKETAGDVGHNETNTLFFSDDKVNQIKQHIEDGGSTARPTGEEGDSHFHKDYVGPFKADQSVSRGTSENRYLNTEDNGDADIEMGNTIYNTLFGREKEYGPLSTVEIIRDAIDYSRKASILSYDIAEVVATRLKHGPQLDGKVSETEGLNEDTEEAWKVMWVNKDGDGELNQDDFHSEESAEEYAADLRSSFPDQQYYVTSYSKYIPRSDSGGISGGIDGWEDMFPDYD